MGRDGPGRDYAGVGLVLLAFLAVSVAGTAAEELLPHGVQPFADTLFLPLGIGAGAMVYRSRVRSGRIAEPYPPLERRAIPRPIQPRPDGEPLINVAAAQAAGSGGSSRGGRLRAYADQVRFDPYRAGPDSGRSWVARRDEVASITATPRRGGITFPWSAPLLTVSLVDGWVADFSVRHREDLNRRLGGWLQAGS